jgi:hypothetical protein
MKTLAAVQPRQIGTVLYQHGEEIPAAAIPEGQLDKLVDAGWIRAYDTSERRSLHRLFAPFSGSKESERLDKAELTAFALPE